MSEAGTAGAAPLLIALPTGLTANGITTWAVRLANGLAAKGRRVGLILHATTQKHKPVEFALSDDVRVFDLTSLPPIETLDGDLSAVIPAYARAVEKIGAGIPSPVVFSPNTLGDCYGAAAALTMTMADRVRIVGWGHLFSAYDFTVLSRYEPAIAGFAACSEAIAAELRVRRPGRAAEIAALPYGVPVAESLPKREPVEGRRLRLIYTGRIELDVKRVDALVAMSDALGAAGVEHELLMLGDGPAEAEIDRMIASRPSITRRGAVLTDAVLAALDRADIFVLPSRIEGLSISMLEAMGRGCVPVVAWSPSGAEQAIADGECGVIVDCDAAKTPEAIGSAMAMGVIKAECDCHRMSYAAWQRATERFSVESHVDAAERLIDRVAESPARAWPASKPAAYSGRGGGGSGAVPEDGPRRMRAVLESLAGRRVVIHGVGRHTIELAGVLAEFGGRIVGFADDDRNRHGGTLWNWPIVAPRDAASALDASDCVISSAMNEGAIWERRAVYEMQGVRVHRVYV